MLPIDVEALGAAYWTANGHKWLCGPKGSGVLHVRADRRERIHPLVISHGFNDLRPDRPRLWKEFDWTGTGDPTPYLALPVALRTIAALHPDGWPGVMRANHELVVEGRRRIAAGARRQDADPGVDARLDGHDPAADRADAGRRDRCPEGLDRRRGPHRGPRSTAGRCPAARESPDALPSAVVTRISAQLYNEPADYDRLAEALSRLLA